MDDLDHSVLIAEQDWNKFYEESEECSLQQPDLAQSDDSGLSDAEESRHAVPELSRPIQSSLEHPAVSGEGTSESQTDLVQGSESGIPSEQPDNTNNLRTDNPEPELRIPEEKCTRQPGQRALSDSNNAGAIPSCLAFEVNAEDHDKNLTKEQQNYSKNPGGQQDERQTEDKTDQVIVEPVTHSPCGQVNRHSKVLEQQETSETVTRVTDDVAGQKTEKERWFVTVNDSPARLRASVCASGQKKRRKKKSSRKSTHRRPTSEGQCPLFRSETEAEGEGDNESDAKDNQFPELQHSNTIPRKVPQNLQLQDEHLSQSGHVIGEPMHCPEGTEGQEPSNERTAILDEALGPTRPIYAISSFWDEMEKLTINDILQLRIANNRSPLRMRIDEETAPTDDNILHLMDQGQGSSKDESLQDSVSVDDTADSDYFTHLDDSKPDRSSCEFSTFSDFDEEFLQILQSVSATPTPEPQDAEEKNQSFLESTDTKVFYQDQTLEATILSHHRKSEDLMMLRSENGTPLYLFPNSDSQDLLLSTCQDPDLSPIIVEGSNAVRATPSPVLSVSDILDDHFLMSLQEIFKEDCDEQEPRARSWDRPRSTVPIPYSDNLSVSESYDYFFSDFEVGNLFFPSKEGLQKTEEKTVPIFSTSHPVVRDAAFPEVEEIVETEEEDECAPIRVMTRFSSQSQHRTEASATPDAYFYTNQRRNWKSLFSLRRIRLPEKGMSWCRQASSWVFPAIARKADCTVWESECTSAIPKVATVSPTHPTTLQLDDLLLQRFAKQQRHLQTAMSVTKRDGFTLSIKQADMCLVCIAFASWVLKSTNPQSADMWKAALLANVSAISAIQYLRQYMNEEKAQLKR
ncbi:uncharacterized protein perm1b [Chanos chanos]|uniref:Uncharacterized protein perm1b n=1 Tax=Chanos chanos TaxID=29144 RepID=A0A6J2VSV0_CHACN|nr:uncharacterized protein LOC115815487 [Chanos chanos]